MEKKRGRKSLPVRNLMQKPAKTAALVILATFLSFSVFGGTVVVRALQRGLDSLHDRLGADIMVVPYEAATKSDLENIVLQGNTGYFYMDGSYLDKIANLEGVGEISAQFYLASASSGCCSIPVQIIGFDPKTDFTISPWIKKSYQSELQDLDVVVGNDLNAFVGDTLTFYGTQVHVAAKLDKTGTNLDTAVYTNESTIKRLIQSSLDKKLNNFGDIDPDRVVSCILINVADGYSVEEVLNDINLHVRKVEAVQTRNMISGISESLRGVSEVIGVLVAVVWIFSLVILVASFVVSVSERKKEFAVLRVVGASATRLSGLVMREGLIVSLLGSLIGIASGTVIITLFSNLIEQQLGLPFLLPSAAWMLLVAVLSLAVSTAAGCLTCAYAGRKIGRMDAGLILREGN